jgi:hypothetical protein
MYTPKPLSLFIVNMSAIPIEKRIFIVKTFYQNSGSVTVVRRQYAKEFGSKDTPAASTISQRIQAAQI